MLTSRQAKLAAEHCLSKAIGYENLANKAEADHDHMMADSYRRSVVFWMRKASEQESNAIYLEREGK